MRRLQRRRHTLARAPGPPVTTRLLLLDAGNTRLKWAVLETDLACKSGDGLSGPLHWHNQGALDYGALLNLPALCKQAAAFGACYGVNVAGEAVASSIQQALAPTGVVPVWLRASVAAGGVTNGYRPPQSLGADRWAALVAARQRTAEAALVVSAGSALTVDALNADGQFLGGLILPGLHMMRQILADSTAQIGLQYGEARAWPNTTADAVETGLMAACTGAIETLYARVEKTVETPPQVLLTGGDAHRIAPFLSLNTRIIPGLVLEGVYYLSQEGQQT